MGTSGLKPPILGLFQKRIDGDDALLELARLRFKEAGLGTEFYAETPAELQGLLMFKPTPETPAVAHLDRGLDLFSDEGRAKVTAFANRFNHDVFGFVIHDQVEIARSFDDYINALKTLAGRLEKVENSPRVYLEYAAGLPLELYLQVCEAMVDMPAVGCCVDIGHVGLWQAKATYARRHPNQDVCALSPRNPQLPTVMEDVREAVRSAHKAVGYAIHTLGNIKKPVHFHLHDGHPLSTLSPFGISDHLSFFEKIDIPFPFRGRKHLNPMFGPEGLQRVVAEAMTQLGPERVSFSLEIHPTGRRLPLDNVGHLFSHWKDKTNGEKMNHWLTVLVENHQLVNKALSA